MTAAYDIREGGRPCSALRPSVNACKKKALEPFRIHISDGTKCDVVHPEFVLVVLTRVEILVPWKESLSRLIRSALTALH